MSAAKMAFESMRKQYEESLFVIMFANPDLIGVIAEMDQLERSFVVGVIGRVLEDEDLCGLRSMLEFSPRAFKQQAAMVGFDLSSLRTAAVEKTSLQRHVAIVEIGNVILEAFTEDEKNQPYESYSPKHAAQQRHPASGADGVLREAEDILKGETKYTDRAEIDIEQDGSGTITAPSDSAAIAAYKTLISREFGVPESEIEVVLQTDEDLIDLKEIMKRFN